MIFWHSAGAQFVHRMVMLMPEARIDTANSGFYTHFSSKKVK